MAIGIDLRSLQDKTSRGTSSYAVPLIQEIVRQVGADPFIGCLSGRFPAPDFKIKIKKLNLPSKITNAALAFFAYPKIDRFLDAQTVWMPNLTFWSFTKNARVVVTIHDLSFIVNPSWYSAKGQIWHQVIGAKKLIARADKIIVLSEHTAQELNELLKVPSEKIAVIPPGVPAVAASLQGNLRGISPSLPNSGDHYIALDAARDDIFSFPYILFIGVIEPRKNIETAIAAFNRLAQKNKDIHFVLAGARPSSYKPQTTNHSSRIHFLGQVSPAKKDALLQNAKALFFPSLYEGFGFPALEAMSAGVPVVASGAGALPETIGRAGVLLEPLDAEAFAEALDQVINDNSLRETLVSRGYERVKDFSWEKCAAETYKIISNA